MYCKKKDKFVEGCEDQDGVLVVCDEVCGEKRVGEAWELHGGGMKSFRRQYQGKTLLIRRCVGILLMRIREGIKV